MASTKSRSATENLLENTDGGVGAPQHCSLGAAPCYLLVMLTRALLMPPLFYRPDLFPGLVQGLQSENPALVRPRAVPCRAVLYHAVSLPYRAGPLGHCNSFRFLLGVRQHSVAAHCCWVLSLTCPVLCSALPLHAPSSGARGNAVAHRLYHGPGGYEPDPKGRQQLHARPWQLFDRAHEHTHEDGGGYSHPAMSALAGSKEYIITRIHYCHTGSTGVAC